MCAEYVMDLPPVMRLTLTGRSNEQYVGTVYIHNSTNRQNHHDHRFHDDDEDEDGGRLSMAADLEDPIVSESIFGLASPGSSYRPRGLIGNEKYFRKPINDPTGATYYVVAVVLVYGFSIVLLIASHIKRKNAKALEDRQINKYLQEFQVVRETSSRDRYRKLKRDITAKLDRKSGPPTGNGSGSTGTSVGGVANTNVFSGYRALTKTALLPLTAIALPTIRETASVMIAKRALSDTPPPRPHPALVSSISNSTTTARPGQVGTGGGVTGQRPWAAALPMRSWRSDDSTFIGRAAGSALGDRRSTTGDMGGKLMQHHETGATVEMASVSECADPRGVDVDSHNQTKVFIHAMNSGGFSPSTSTVSSSGGATIIPIIISTPEETSMATGSMSSSIDDELHASSSGQFLSPYRRSSCPNPLLAGGRGSDQLQLSTLSSTSGGDERPSSVCSSFGPPSSASSSSCRPPSGHQFSASLTTRKRRRDNWLGFHNDLKQKQFNSSCNLQQHQQQASSCRFIQQRRTSIQSQISCDGVIDEEPEVASSANLQPSGMMEQRRKSTSAALDRVTLSAMRSSPSACLVSRQTMTLEVPGAPFFFAPRPGTSPKSAAAGDATQTTKIPFDRGDSGMSTTMGSALSVVSP